MAEIVNLKGAPVADFDALVMQINASAQLLANIALAANVSSERDRAEFYARACLETYDERLSPAIAELRARLARPNPFATEVAP